MSTITGSFLFVATMLTMILLVLLKLQDGGHVDPEVSKREKARLKEMQKLKKQKIQEILDQQNASIDADMVCAYRMPFLPYVMVPCLMVV